MTFVTLVAIQNLCLCLLSFKILPNTSPFFPKQARTHSPVCPSLAMRSNVHQSVQLRSSKVRKQTRKSVFLVRQVAEIQLSGEHCDGMSHTQSPAVPSITGESRESSVKVCGAVPRMWFEQSSCSPRLFVGCPVNSVRFQMSFNNFSSTDVSQSVDSVVRN